MRPTTMTQRRGAFAPVASLCIVLVLAACGDTGETAVDRPSAEEDSVTQGASPDPTPSAPGVPGASGGPARRAVADLAERLGVAEDEISVVAVEAVTWNDGSLGCAEKGMAYTQALVEGARITLQADGRTFAYHAAGNRAPFYCANPTQ
jgi:hypothetical protein